MKIKGFILAAVFAFAYASSVMAGTLFNDQPFNGLYVGVLGGYGHEDNTTSGTINPPFVTGPFSADLGNEGETYGAFGGYGTMLGSMLYIGLEGQYNFFNRESSEQNIGGINFRTSTDDGWNVGGRLGLVLGGNTLLFARGAFSEINVSIDQTPAPDTLDMDTLEGYEVGLGAEYAISNHFTVRGEYVYSNYGSVDINYTAVNPPTDAGNYDLTSSEIRLALTLEF